MDVFPDSHGGMDEPQDVPAGKIAAESLLTLGTHSWKVVGVFGLRHMHDELKKRGVTKYIFMEPKRKVEIEVKRGLKKRP